MDLWKLGISLFCGIAIAQSFFLSLYLLIKTRRFSFIFLSVILLANAFRNSKSLYFFIMESSTHWGIVLATMGVLCIGPSFWLYALAEKDKPISPYQYLHFLPAVMLLGIGMRWGVSFVIGVYYMASIAMGAYLLQGWDQTQQAWQGKPQHASMFFFGLGLIWIISLVQLFVSGIVTYTVGTALICLILYFINFKIMADPNFFHFPLLQKNKALPTKQQEALGQQIERVFQEQRLYLQKGLSLNDLAQSLDQPTYLLSKTINQHYGMRFNEFVNQYRVEAVKARLAAPGSSDKIEVIAQETGFSSTSSLYQAFKKGVGCTPQQYRKAQREGG